MKLKLFSSAIILMILLVGTVTAFEFDNKKYYDKNTQTITIKNSFLGLPLDTVATIKLITPREIVINNIDEYIAEFEINNFEKYKNFLKEVETFKEIDGGKVLDYNYNYKYFNKNIGTHKEYFIEEFVYENGTKYNLTNSKDVMGSWLMFDEELKLPVSNIKLRMFFDRNIPRNRIIEVIPTFYGKRIDEWFIVEMKQFYDTGDDGGKQIFKEPEGSESHKAAQCFTPQSVHTIQTISVYINTLGTSEGTLWGGVYYTEDNTSGTAPTSPTITPIANFVNVSQGTIGTSSEWYNLTFSDKNVTTINNATLCIVLRGTGSGGELYNWRFDNTGATYTFGALWGRHGL